MLKHSRYQAVRFFSQAGTCCTTATTTTSSGGSSSIAGIKKTFVAWYDWLRGVLTSATCASAAPVAKSRNVIHTLSPYVAACSRGTKGEATSPATIAIVTRYAVAASESRRLPLGLGSVRSPSATSVGTALTLSSRSVARTACPISPDPGREPQKESGSMSQVKGGQEEQRPPSE